MWATNYFDLVCIQILSPYTCTCTGTCTVEPRLSSLIPSLPHPLGERLPGTLA